MDDGEPTPAPDPEALAPEWDLVKGEAFIRSLFPEADSEGFVWSAHWRGIAYRIVERGGVKAIRWIRATLGDRALRALIESRQGRGIDPHRLRLWQVLLGLPEDMVTRWIAAPERRNWDRRSA